MTKPVCPVCGNIEVKIQQDPAELSCPACGHREHNADLARVFDPDRLIWKDVKKVLPTTDGLYRAMLPEEEVYGVVEFRQSDQTWTRIEGDGSTGFVTDILAWTDLPRSCRMANLLRDNPPEHERWTIVRIMESSVPKTVLHALAGRTKDTIPADKIHGTWADLMIRHGDDGEWSFGCTDQALEEEVIEWLEAVRITMDYSARSVFYVVINRD